MARAFAGARVSAGVGNGGSSGGTPGGRTASTSRPGRPNLMLGDEVYLWALVLIEVFTMAALRKRFRRYHGG